MIGYVARSSHVLDWQHPRSFILPSSLDRPHRLLFTSRGLFTAISSHLDSVGARSALFGNGYPYGFIRLLRHLIELSALELKSPDDSKMLESFSQEVIDLGLRAITLLRAFTHQHTYFEAFGVAMDSVFHHQTNSALVTCWNAVFEASELIGVALEISQIYRQDSVHLDVIQKTYRILSETSLTLIHKGS